MKDCRTAMCNIVSSLSQLFVPHFVMAVFMCIHLHYRIHKQWETFKLSSILRTVDLSKHLIAAWIFQKFIQLDNFVNFSIFFFFLGNRVRLNVYERALALGKWDFIITGNFCLWKRLCKNLFNAEHFCDKILSTQVKIQTITNLTCCNRRWNGLKRRM